MGGIVLVVFLAAVFLLYSTARLQRGLLSKAPEYSGQQLYGSAVQQIEKGDYTEAESDLEKALLKEDDATYRNQLAVVKYRLGKYDEAVQQYQKLIDTHQDEAFAWNGMGNAYRDWAAQDAGQAADRLAKASNAYRQAILADKGYTAAYSNLALLLSTAGKKTEALQVLDQGIAATGGADLHSVRDSLDSK
jgi:tetratricopeptide (TPR) repeat protein